MNEYLTLRRPASSSGVFHLRAAASLSLLLVVALLSACETVKPGSRPEVVRAEQSLKAADAIYKAAMEYYFRPGVAASMSPSTVKIFEKVRTGYDPAYKAAQSAIDAYKAGRAGDIAGTIKALADILNVALPLLGQPSLKPVEVP